MDWLIEMAKLDRAVGGVALCLAVFALGVRQGWVTVGKRYRPVPQPSAAKLEAAAERSDRYRAVRQIDTIEAENLDPPSNWKATFDKTAETKAKDAVMSLAMPEINKNSTRLSALEPRVGSLESSNKVLERSVIRLEAMLEGVQRALGEVVSSNKTLADEVRVAMTRK